ncbi:hypothetical protein GGS23DRAFT_573326 [Durotheca rogersii]|uniref:uncharacterized protein n=1 Tax=Durotheca rogersii TaxID=419775 RepID=UPI002220A7D5|nr:uncharacterized protein GGS23DRAFT_573326 [Durotheca rogersii]KAI5862228.1 hypothetical protein GGS23DRAFT_573326 [Durotheca rogersii]
MRGEDSGHYGSHEPRQAQADPGAIRRRWGLLIYLALPALVGAAAEPLERDGAPSCLDPRARLSNRPHKQRSLDRCGSTGTQIPRLAQLRCRKMDGNNITYIICA